MERKLIAIDVDGTLINDALVMSSFTRDVLSRLIQQGHIVVLASGRPWRSIAPFYQAIGSQDPVIAYNGIYVFNPKNEGFIPLKHPFPQAEIQTIAQKLGKKVTSFMCESETMIYLQREDAYLDHYFPYKKEKHQIGNIGSIVHEDVYTAIFRSSHQNVPFIQSVVEGTGNIAYRHWTSSYYSEAYYRGVDKGSGLSYIANELQFKKDDIIAFGDSLNDLEMLEAAGQGFSVFHCKSRVLSEKFPATLADNNHDGVALTLEKLLLK
jgi:5-amino-6-(5-phospho-D-ribitylamino)uracil phosphatase